MPNNPNAPRPGAPGGITRRDFNRRAACTAAGLILAATVPAQAEDGAPDPEPSAGSVNAASPRPVGLIESVALVRSAAPELPEEDAEELERQVKSAMDLVKTLREAELADGTEPGFVFRALNPARKART